MAQRRLFILSQAKEDSKWKKIVQRIPRTASPAEDFIGLVDCIEAALDLSTGKKSLRTRLTELTEAGGLDSQSAHVLQEAIQRLDIIEKLLLHNLGFETAKETYRE